LLLLSGLSIRAQQPLPTTPAGQPVTLDPYLRNSRLGLAHVSAPEGGTDPERYRLALTLGAGWNRFPIYWDRIEQAPGQFNWAAYDRQIADDLLYRLSINAILLGRPSFFAEGDRITGLHNPIFADGTDTPAPGKALNPDNPWANFVFQTVDRYRPNGVLNQQGTTPAGIGVTTWEIWNEPDVKLFWSSSIGDYARLLKVAYLSAKQADPTARVMFAGLLFNTDDNWLARVLAIYQSDPQREANNWYMDAVAAHAYADPWRTGWLTLNLKQTLIAYGLQDKPIWITENGVPVWDDYPGPTWESDPTRRQLRATQLQQARYVIQSAVYAWSEGADVIIFHQLYDDCGDQPAGTDFPPNAQALCSADRLCSGDAHGLYRNPAGSVCFSQHPQPGTPRPAADAFALLSQVFRPPFTALPDITLLPEQVMGGVPSNLFAAGFRQADGTVSTVFWNRTLQPVSVTVSARGLSAQLITLDGDAIIQPDSAGTYTLTLPPADPDNFQDLQAGSQAAIGGAPMILRETPDAHIVILPLRPKLGGALVSLPPLVVESATPGAVAVAPARPTTDPAQDVTPPEAIMDPLPEVSPTSFTVSWRGRDDSGVDLYLVWVRINDGEWQPWRETADMQASYVAAVGDLLEFDVWARDLAGNWTARATLMAQATTRIE
jgi:hypothetical protein